MAARHRHEPGGVGPVIFEIKGLNPVPWTSSTAARRKGGGTQFFKDAGLATFQDALKQAVADQLASRPELVGELPGPGPVSLRLLLWRQLDSSTRRSGKKHRAHRADATNMQKAIEDALQGVLFDNDRDVAEVHTSIVEQDDDTDPMIVIRVVPAVIWSGPQYDPDETWVEIDLSPPTDVAEEHDAGFEF
jgi:Holliday junction resolvase RusA-like endonuclease